MAPLDGKVECLELVETNSLHWSYFNLHQAASLQTGVPVDGLPKSKSNLICQELSADNEGSALAAHFKRRILQ